MNRPSEHDAPSGLPPDLAELDAELSQFTAAERSSFAPELEAELEREWLRGARRPRYAPARRAVAATVAGVVLTGLAVPPARASIVDGLQRLIGAFQEATTAGAVAVDSPVPAVPPSVGASDPLVEPVAVSPPPAVATDDEEAELPAFRPPRVTYPSLVDEEAERELIRRHYPPALQRAGIGGTVRLLLWVAEDGTVDDVQIRSNSGVPALDRSAMQGAGSLRFNPATRDGRPVGTYVEFDVVFEPMEEEWIPPEVVPDDPALPPEAAYEVPGAGPLTVFVPTSIQMEARDLLIRALGGGDAAVEERLGPVEGLLNGDPPRGVSPLRWRREAGAALEGARARDPGNPAPVLALARIRRKQGLREEARDLLAGSLDRPGAAAPAISPRLVAELNFELGSIVRESWLSRAGLGNVPAEELDRLNCSRRGGRGIGVETLVAWNYVCPDELGAVLDRSFEPRAESDRERRAMLARVQAAVEAYPAHVGANVAILLDMADREMWLELLNQSRRFAWASEGHPYSLLMSGLALQRVGRSEEAVEDFQQAFAMLGRETEDAFRAVATLGVDDATDPEDFWVGLDPILHTEVNERQVEHLARAAYAYLRFGDLTSDPSRLWLRYGRPEAVRVFGRADLRTEFWDYGRGPSVTLSRPASSDQRSFTPEAEVYLEELRSVFPHWYGTRARRVRPLEAQVSRFRGAEPGEGEVEIHFEVPPSLATPGGEPLELGIFSLDADGSPVAREGHRVTGSTMHLRADVAPGVAGLVVELFDPATREAAALRVPAFRDPTRGDDPRISDLLLVSALDPAEGAISRADPAVRPLVRRRAPVDGQIGVLFELYGLSDGGDAYHRLGFELVSDASGRSWSVPSRPGGQSVFGTGWARRRAARTPTESEYLTLDLAGVPPGAYTLRVTVTPPDGAPLVEELTGVTLGESDGTSGSGGTVEGGGGEVGPHLD